jgi:hypothetical protein
VFPVPAKWFSGLPGGCLGIFWSVATPAICYNKNSFAYIWNGLAFIVYFKVKSVSTSAYLEPTYLHIERTFVVYNSCTTPAL